MSYRWYESMSHKDQNDIKTLDDAIGRLLAHLSEDAKDNGFEEIDFVIRSPFGSKGRKEGMVVTSKDIASFVKADGWCQVGWQPKKKREGYCDGEFGGVETMSYYRTNEANQDKWSQERLQKSANGNGRVWESWRHSPDPDAKTYWIAIPEMTFVRQASGKVWHRVASHFGLETRKPIARTLCDKSLVAKDCRYSDSSDHPRVTPCKQCGQIMSMMENNGPQKHNATRRTASKKSRSKTA